MRQPKELHTVQLTYRFQTYEYTPGAVQHHRQAYALNWRFRTPKHDHTLAMTTPAPLQVQPQSTNWRFQIAAK